MANSYSTRSAYNSFLINTVMVSEDYTVQMLETGTLFLIDGSGVGDSLDISLPSPDHAGMYYKFVFTVTTEKIVNIQLQDDTDGFVGMIVQYAGSSVADVDIATTGASDRMEFAAGQKPGSWIEVVSNGSQWVVTGHHNGAAHVWRDDS